MTMMTMATFISLANILSNTVSARDRGLSSASGRGSNRRRLRSAARASQAVRVGCCSLWVMRFLSRCMDGSNELQRGSRASESPRVLASFQTCIKRGGESVVAYSQRIGRSGCAPSICGLRQFRWKRRPGTFRMDLNAPPTLVTADGRRSRW